MKGLKDLETQNKRLRRAVSDLTLDKLILWISSFCRRLPGETSKPRASPSLHEHVRDHLHVSELRACAALGSIARRSVRSRGAERMPNEKGVFYVGACGWKK